MPSVTLKNGNLYIDSTVYDTYLKSADSVVLINKDAKCYLMPVQQMAGGLLMKIMNAKGDRVINAVEFLQSNHIDISSTKIVDVTWDQTYSALAFELN